MKEYLNKIREPVTDGTLKNKIFYTIGVMLTGVALGIIQKWLDSTAHNEFPSFIQALDIGNYFGRLSIWILLGTMISVYSKTPIRAGVNVFSFLISMLIGYYAYSKFILGFLSVPYMMIWVKLSILSFFMAYVCWYAKGKGAVSIIISSFILAFLFSQAVALFQGIRIIYFLDFFTWLIGILILCRKPKEMAVQLGLSLLLAAMYQNFIT